VFTQDSLPLDADMRDRLFGDEVRAGDVESPMDITDVWKNAYSENTSRKVWAAKYTARHPFLVALELSNFKCGHDAPHLLGGGRDHRSARPIFSFKDLDENRPAGSIKIRVETIGYFLKRYREDLIRGIDPHEALQGARGILTDVSFAPPADPASEDLQAVG
jgi:predicted nucleotide-binding protein (sugar kinase/HSP70/actin superfamily)